MVTEIYYHIDLMYKGTVKEIKQSYEIITWAKFAWYIWKK